MRWREATALGFLFISAMNYFFAPTVSEAASLYIDPPSKELLRGDSLTLSVRVDVDEQAGECINVVDAVLNYPPSIEPVDVSIGDSILRFWIEEPIINKEARTITFAGGIPNGYCGRIPGDPRLTNVVTEIVFRSPGMVVGMKGEDTSKAIISFGEETTVYLNDGFGTKAKLATYPSIINLSDDPGSLTQNEWKDEVSADQIPPEDFSIILATGDEFGGRHAIIFNTTDKQTGIDHYDVIEEPVSKFGAFEWGRADAPWIEASSPYILKDQSLNSIIRVKAIDKAGNEYIATLIPDPSLQTISQAQLLMIAAIVLLILVLIVIVLVLVKFVRSRQAIRRAKPANPTANDEESLEP